MSYFWLLFRYLKKICLGFLVLWEIFFIGLGNLAPVYAQEASTSATGLISQIEQASQSAAQTVDQLTSVAKKPDSLSLPFDSQAVPIKVTTWFGEKNTVFTQTDGDRHNGIDFYLKDGTAITAVDDGQIIISGDGDYGTTVTIQHSWGKSVYGHLSKTNVFKNQLVKKGQPIGESGQSGNSTGPHLHIGIKLIQPSDEQIDGFVDPAPFFGLTPPQISSLISPSSSASLDQQLQQSTASASFEDLRGQSGYLYNYKFNLPNEGAIHFQHRTRNEPGFAVIDKNAQAKLRFFLKQQNISSSQLINLKHNQVEFPVVIEGIPMTLRYTVSSQQIKEELIISEKPSATLLSNLSDSLSIQFAVENEGLTTTDQGEGAYKFQSDGGDYWQIQTPNITDLNKTAGKITANLKDQLYTMQVDANYLKNASYPVTIDPTVVITSSNSTQAVNPSTMRHLVRTSNGTLHAFIQMINATATCNSNSKSGLLWFISNDTGATWTCQDQISSDTSNSFFADARVDSSDNIYIAYSQTSSGAGTAKDLFYRKLTKGSGASWTTGAAQTVLDGTASIGYGGASIELEGNTRIWLAVRYYDGANYQIPVYYSDGLTDAPNWTQSTSAVDTAGANSAFHLPIVVRFGSKIGVVYSDDTLNTGRFKFRADTDSLSNWSNQASFSNSIGATFSAVGDNQGNVYAIGNGGSNMSFNYFNGTTWSTNSTPTATFSNNNPMQLSTDGAGNVWIVYKDTTGLNSNLPNSSNSKLVYKIGRAPYTTSDFDTNPTPVVSSHGTFDKVWRFASSAYGDVTTAAGDSTAADTSMISSSGDIMYFGKTEKFDSMSWFLSTAGTTGVIAWEYWNGSTWSSLTLDYSLGTNFTVQGGGNSFVAPSDWATTAVNGEGTSYYYVRARATSGFTVSPVGTQFVSIPSITSISYMTQPVSNSLYGIWAENGGAPAKIRFNSTTIAQNTTPAATADLLPTVLGYANAASATQVSTQRHTVKTSDGTLHSFIQSAFGSNAAQLACGGSSSPNSNTGLMWLYSTDSGANWSCGGQISSDTTNLMNADARVDSSDNIYLVYSQSTTGAGAAKDVFYRKLTKGSGASWTIGTAQLVLDGTASVGYHYATLELDSNRVWLAARHFDGLNYQVTVYYSDGLTDAPTWTQSTTNLDTPGTASNAHFPTMVRFGTKIGVIYIVNTGNIPNWRYRSDSDGLTSWNTEAQVTSAGVGAATFSAIADSSANIYFVLNSNQVIFTYWNGTSWSSNVTVSNISGSSLFSSISVDNASPPNVYIVYPETSGLSSSLAGPRKLVYKKGASPYASGNFDSNSTAIISYHGIFDKVQTFISSAYAVVTTAAGNTTTADVTLPAAVGEIAYFGKTEKFDSLSTVMSTAGTGGQVIWEYYNGSTWMPLTEYYGGSNPNFGTGYINFMPHTDWATTDINSQGSYYYVRARVVTAFTNTPVMTQAADIPFIAWGGLVPNTQAMQAVWSENSSSQIKVRFKTVQSFNATPSTPTSLGPTAVVNGSFSSTTSPNFSFTLADTDSSDTLKFQIQIDDSADFSSPVVDYTSALAAQGSRSFTVGQAVGSGSYTTGSSGQTLSDGSYYWRVKAIDNGGSASGWATANSGAIAFKIDTTSPSTPTNLTSSSHSLSTWSSDTTIDISWTASTDSGGIAGYSYSFTTSSTTTPDTTADTSSTTATSTSLASGIYYFHVRAIDNAGNAGTTAHQGPYWIDSSGPSTPGSPTTQNPTADTTPTWSWTASTDSGAGLAATPYTVQWSSDSGFSSITGSSTTATNSFTHPTDLTEGSWYFRVKATDLLGNDSAYASGSVVIDKTNPGSIDLDSPAADSFTSNPRPVFRWKAAAVGDSGVGLSSYTFHIDNGSDGDIDITNIPISGSGSVTTSKYVLTYDNFADSDTTNNYISLYTNSSADWAAWQNDGKLREGKRSWYVSAFDTAGNSYTSSRTLYADFTSPGISNIQIENVDTIDNYLLVTSTKPKISGKIVDNLAYDKLELAFSKENFFLGILVARNMSKIITHNFNNLTNDTNLDFSFLSDQELDYGKYYLTITGIDKVGNRSASTSFKINLLSYEKAKELISQRDQAKLEQLKNQADLSIADLEKKAILRRQKEAGELEKLIAQLKQDLGFIYNITSGITGAAGSFFAYHKSQLPLFVQDLADSLASLGQTSTQLAFNWGRFLTGEISHIAFVTRTAAQKWNTDLTSNILAFGLNLGNLSNQLATSALDHVGSIGRYTPLGVKRFLSAVFITPFEPLNDALDRAPRSLSESFDQEYSHSSQGIAQTIAAFIQFNSYLNQIADSSLNQSKKGLGTTFGSIRGSTAYLAGFSHFVAFETVSLINQANRQLIGYADNSLVKVKLNLKDKFDDSSNGLSANIAKSTTALTLAYQSAVKPLAPGADLLDRVRIGALTFQAIVFDDQPTRIANVTIEEIGRDYAIISWQTNHYATGKVNYGTDLRYGQEVILDKRATYHQARLTNLQPGKRIFFEVMSEGKNYTYDAYYSFETAQ